MNCGSCKYFAQGENCSFCENPKQKDKDAKQYRYYVHSCELYEKGISQSRIDYMKRPDVIRRSEEMKAWPNQTWFKELKQRHIINPKKL